MALREDIFTPIPGENPGGQDLRYTPIYDKIKEARREEEDIAQGAWQTERKLADWPQVIKLCQEAIATKSKDLQLAAWLTEALLKTQGYAGLAEGLHLCHQLIAGFWDSLYPELEDGDAELRATPLEFVANYLLVPVRSVALVRERYSYLKYKESREVGYEDAAKTDKEKKAREAKLKDGKLTPELFDKAFNETPKVFYVELMKNLDACIANLQALDELCQEKFGDIAPGFGKLKEALNEIHHVAKGFLQKKRELEPDPVEEAAVEAPAAVDAEGGQEAAAAAQAGGGIGAVSFTIPAFSGQDPADVRQAIGAVVSAAAFLRKKDPTSPAPYLMLRGLRFGELRSAGPEGDLKLLEAPPTDLRRHLKMLAMDGKWKDLLEACENAMALPASRGWLDLQRFTVEACVALGREYHCIAAAIRSEVRALVRDLPELPKSTLTDDTPAANAETLQWIKELVEEPEAAPMYTNGDSGDGLPGWKRKFIDTRQLAEEALRKGQEQRALEILYMDAERQRAGRERFHKRLRLVEFAQKASKDTIVQQMIDEMLAQIDNNKLEEWEDRAWLASTLITLMKASKRIQADAKEKQKIIDRICRLDPVQALSVM